MRISTDQTIDMDDQPNWISPDTIAAAIVTDATDLEGPVILLRVVGGRESEPDTVATVDIVLNPERIAGTIAQLLVAGLTSGITYEELTKDVIYGTNLMRDAAHKMGKPQ